MDFLTWIIVGSIAVYVLQGVEHRRRVRNQILVEYTGQYFNEIPWRDETWESQNVIIGTSHTSSS